MGTCLPFIRTDKTTLELGNAFSAIIYLMANFNSYFERIFRFITSVKGVCLNVAHTTFQNQLKKLKCLNAYQHKRFFT